MQGLLGECNCDGDPARTLRVLCLLIAPDPSAYDVKKNAC